jgi:nucleoid DNA-binding protein
MLIIWRGLVTYLDNNLRQGKSVNIRKFGAFTFDIDTDLPKISTRTINPYVDF